ncbi:MAG: ABC transporter permease [Proteobacteria bacterium]|nr:MAG: ABC transporter permease [Pseudomonadota bacterium]
MAETLRQSVNHVTPPAKFKAKASGKISLARLLASAGVCLILLPIVPGLLQVLWPAFSMDVWQALISDNQFFGALTSTLMTAVGSTLLSLSTTCAIAIWLYPNRGWATTQRQLPLFLAFPHVAFAIGIAFLVAPSGWFVRGLANVLAWSSPPQWVSIRDPYAISLTLTLAIKETWFLLWVMATLLGEQAISRQITLANSLGYSRRQAWLTALLPQLLPRMAWPLVAVLAYSLSVVDMAVILGPSTPPTLAVISWQWLTDPNALTQAKGSASALCLILLLAVLILLGRGIWALIKRLYRNPRGIRTNGKTARGNALAGIPIFIPGWLALAMLGLWSVAGGWFFPNLWPNTLTLTSWYSADFGPMLTTLWIAMVTVMLALPLTLLWLEWGSAKHHGWLYAPLILPSLPIAAAQYQVLLHLNLDSTAIGVIWSHLAWTFPYMLLVLVGPYKQFDPRYMLTAQALGRSHLQACLSVKWPMLIRPILAAMSVGFAVSVAQYIPTLFSGGGRFATVTTEAVALSAGGNRRVLAVQSLLQTALPLCAFMLAIVLTAWYSRNRQGLK